MSAEIVTDGTHLMCSDVAELHRFARRMGLRRAWFQDSSDHPHYDLTTPRARRRALAAGARLVSIREVLALVKFFRQRKKRNSHE